MLANVTPQVLYPQHVMDLVPVDVKRNLAARNAETEIVRSATGLPGAIVPAEKLDPKQDVAALSSAQQETGRGVKSSPQQDRAWRHNVPVDQGISV